MSDPRVFWAFLPFALLVFFYRKLPSSFWSAALSAALAGVAAGAATLGVLFSVLGFFSMSIDPGQLLVIIIITLLLMVHWAMLKAEAGVANYVIGRTASYSAPYREYCAMAGAFIGHCVWWYMAYRYINPSLYRDEFAGLFLEMIVPSALLAAPLAALGAMFAPKA